LRFSLSVTLPPLCERREDIPVLTDHFLTRHFRRRGEQLPVASPGVREAFVRHGWPGNVRERERLRAHRQNLLVRLVAHRVRLDVHHAADGEATQRLRTQPGSGGSSAGEGSTLPAEITPISLRDRIRELEANLIASAQKSARVTRVTSRRRRSSCASIARRSATALRGAASAPQKR
jgi:DNA-binding NtrC family response regulator